MRRLASEVVNKHLDPVTLIEVVSDQGCEERSKHLRHGD